MPPSDFWSRSGSDRLRGDLHGEEQRDEQETESHRNGTANSAIPSQARIDWLAFESHRSCKTVLPNELDQCLTFLLPVHTGRFQLVTQGLKKFDARLCGALLPCRPIAQVGD